MSAAEVLGGELYEYLSDDFTLDSCNEVSSDLLAALKAAGYAVIELPKPDTPHPSWRGTWFGGDSEDVYPETKYAVYDPGGDVIISGVTRLTRADARSLAGALIAAAEATS